jgi:hypothetical protein
MNNISEDQSLIQLETLEKQYGTLLSQYEEAYNTYINYLQQDEQIAVSDYAEIIGGGGICTGTTGTFPDGTQTKYSGFYPPSQCAALCDENPYCAGYNLIGPNDSNGNSSCNLFSYTDASGISNTNGEGCFTKKNYTTPTTTTTTTTSYGIVGIGTDGMDYFKSSLSSPWQRLSNDSTGDLIACAINPSNNMYYVVDKNNNVSFKSSYNDFSFTNMNNCSESTSYKQISVNGDTNLICSGGTGYTNVPGYPYWKQQTQADCETTCTNDPNCVAYDMVPNGQNNGTNQCAFFTGANNFTPVGGNSSFLGCYEKTEQISCIIDLAISPDGQYGVVIDTKRQLWSGPMSSFLAGFTPAANPNQVESSIAVAISPLGEVFTVGGNQLYSKPSYMSLSGELWAGPLSSSSSIQSVTFAPDGTMIAVGTDFSIYTKPPDNGYTSAWTNVSVANDTQVVSIAAVNTSKTSTSVNSQAPTQISNGNALAEFTALQGKNFWGSGPLNEGTVSSLQDCETMCASDVNCSGATFQSDKNYCYTRTGEGDIVTGADTDYALIPQVRQSLISVLSLNNQLLDINQQIQAQLDNLYPIAKKDEAAKNAKQLQLNINYARLFKEKSLIEVRLQDNETLEQEYLNNTLLVNQTNILLKFWSLFALVVLAITFKIVFKVKGSSFIFLIITTLLIMIFLSLDWISLIPIVLLPLLFKMIYYPS